VIANLVRNRFAQNRKRFRFPRCLRRNGDTRDRGSKPGRGGPQFRSSRRGKNSPETKKVNTGDF
jgi:hypothetical protein